jgi:hypothetical protein
MSESNRQLLSIGVLILTIAVAVVLYVAALIGWTLIIPVVLLLFGLWIIALGAIRAGKPIKYERSPFSTVAIGCCIAAVGGAWFLFSYNWLYSLIVVLVAIAVLAIVAAQRRK